MINISPMYAGLLALLFIALTVRVVLGRRSLGVGLGHGDNQVLLRRIRVHGNFAEYVPFGLLLMTLIEWQNGPRASLHLIGILLLLGRGIHAYSLSHEPELRGFRVIGMGCTLSALGVGGFVNLLLSAGAMWLESGGQ